MSMRKSIYIHKDDLIMFASFIIIFNEDKDNKQFQ